MRTQHGATATGVGRIAALEEAERPGNGPDELAERTWVTSAAVGARGDNLPLRSSPFVGRARELAELGAMVAVSRMVTVVGGPGIGKTRLALELAARTAARQPGGSWLVRLESVSDPALVPRAVASAMALAPEPGRPVTESLVRHVANQRMLVILDNCEHVVARCRSLVAILLEACPRLTVLATSQQPLGAVGEQLWRLDPLSLGSDATALFVARARAVQPEFRLTPETAPTVATICRGLDGIPLAIELAAARVAVLSLPEIAERLGRRFKLLTGGPESGPARHQTLRSALDWSWELLPAPEAALLRRLSIFAGGASLETVEAVCRGGDVDRDDVVDLLAGLVAKSLVTADTTGTRARYRLLETVRAYGRERLEEAGETARVARAHASAFLQLAERSWRPQAATSGKEPPFVALEREYDNLRAALEWSLTHRDVVVSLRLASALTLFWRNRGYLAEGQQWLQRSLMVSAGAMPAVRARALCGLAVLATLRGDLATALPAVEQSVTLARAKGIHRAMIEGLNLRGLIAVLSQDPQAALEALEEALSLAREAGDGPDLADALNLFGRANLFLGRTAVARRSFAECARVEDLEGQNCSAGIAGLGWLAMTQGRHDDAQVVLAGALERLREEGEPFETALVLSFLAELAWLRGEPAEANEAAEEGLELARAIGAPYPMTRCLTVLGWLAFGEDDGERAITLMDESVATARRGGLRYALVRALVARARLAATSREVDGARDALVEAVDLARANADPAGTATGLHQLGRLAWLGGDDEHAQALYHQALQLHLETDAVGGTVESLEALAALAPAQGRPAYGACMLGAASGVRRAHGILRTPPDGPCYDDDVARVRSAVDSDEWETAWAQGAALSLDEAVSLATRGRGRRDRPSTGWASLTEVEAQTAALVAEGLTNREAAERLFISPRTVQGHLIRVFAKLGISSRRELREAARRRRENAPV